MFEMVIQIALKKVFDTNVSGDGYLVQKIECMGHVQKRMGTRLCNLLSITLWPLADGKTVGGRGRLKGDQIKATTQYYGNAIRDNRGDLKSMREAVWAIWFHKGSSHEHPVRNFCRTSWCLWKQAQAEGTLQTCKHNLSLAIIDEIKPIFKDLAKRELSQNCLAGYAQNAMSV